MNIKFLCSLLLLSLTTSVTQCMEEEQDEQIESQHCIYFPDDSTQTTANALADLIVQYHSVKKEISLGQFLENKEASTPDTPEDKAHQYLKFMYKSQDHPGNTDIYCRIKNNKFEFYFRPSESTS